MVNPDSAQVIRQWSPSFATLATNHVLDAGEDGLVKTMQTLHDMGFTTVGAGRTWDEITQPICWETSEGRLAIVNWVFPETHPDWMSIPGPNCWPGLEEAKGTIRRLKSQADWLMIVTHWSDEYFAYPPPEDRAIARELARAGADLLIGHHPHVVRGMEMIATCPVFYSIGDFYFSDISDQQGGWLVRHAPRNREGLGISISFRRGMRPDYHVLSFWQTKRQAVLDPQRRAARRMQRISQPLQQLQDSEYAEWYAAKRTGFDKWGYRLHFALWQLGIRGLVRYLFRRTHSHLRRSF
jgi:hypothetical protein